jgi:sugar fermentation stimulation protein A
VIDGLGLFPDAPTARGRKHVAELTKLRQSGARAVVFFVVQRDDAHSVAANHRTDLKFAEALQNAHRCGVELIAYNCEVTSDFAAINQRIPVIVD